MDIFRLLIISGEGDSKQIDCIELPEGSKVSVGYVYGGKLGEYSNVDLRELLELYVKVESEKPCDGCDGACFSCPAREEEMRGYK